ncbi:MAG: undecaprenyl-diphosphate phosphatase, partial [Fimbriiglobus sp.]
MSLWEAVVLGVVQGLTEFLPISSTAHLVFARELLGHPHSNDAFTTVIQLGTLAAVFVYFRADIVRLASAVVRDLRAGRPLASADSRLAWMIAVGSIPAVLVGLLAKDVIKSKDTFYNLRAMAWVAIGFAVLMAAAEWWGRFRAKTRPARGENAVTWADAVWVGLWQALALMPGASRSGTTITGGLFAGLDRSAAARFSFLLSLPTILGAGLKELYDEFKKLKSPVEGGPPSLFASADDAAALAVGLLVSGVVG